MADDSNNSPGPRAASARTWRDDVSAEWTRFVSGFTRENIISNLKTLAWVVPLTLLIWIWAEREQVQPAKDVSVPFELTSSDPNRIVSLKPPQDKNLVLELQGPQGRLQELLSRLRAGTMPEGLKVDVPTSYQVNQDWTLDTLPLVRGQKIFADYGVTVLGVQPTRIEVAIDQLVEREARVVTTPTIKNVDATFDPPTVKVRGPMRLLNRALQAPAAHDDSGRLVIYGDVRTTPQGHHDEEDVLLTRPSELQDDRVALIAPKKIHASVDVRQADKTARIPSMTVTVDCPDSLLDKYKVVWDRQPVIQNITVTGPPDLIDALQRQDFEPKPKARVVVTQQDAAGGDMRTKVVQYDLPKGVEVSDEDKKRTVSFKLVDRSQLPPS